MANPAVRIALLADAADAIKGFRDTAQAADRAGREITNAFEGAGHNLHGTFDSFVSESKRIGEHAGEKLSGGLLSHLKRGAGRIGEIAHETVTDFGGRFLEELTFGVSEAFSEAINGAQDAAKQARLLASQVANLGPAGRQAFAEAGKFAEDWGVQIGQDDDRVRAVLVELASFPDAFRKGSLGAEAMQRATKAAFDLEAIGIGNAESNIIGIGKALNDPLKGLTALTKQGVSFSAEQKKQIKNFVKQGNLAGAQRTLLAGIESNAKGAAEAAASPVQKMKVAFDNFLESVASRALPFLNKFATFFIERILPALEKVADFVADKLFPAFQKVGAWISANVFPIFKQVADFVAGLHLENLFKGLGSIDLSGLIAPGSLFGEAIANDQAAFRVLRDTVVQVWDQIVKGWNQFVRPALEKLAQVMREEVMPAVHDIAQTWRDQFEPVMKRVGQFIASQVQPAMEAIGDAIRNNVAPALQSLAKFWRDNKEQIEPMLAASAKLIGVLAFIAVAIGAMSAIAGIKILAVSFQALVFAAEATVSAFLAIRNVGEAAFGGIIGALQFIAAHIGDAVLKGADIIRQAWTGLLSFTQGLARGILAVWTGILKVPNIFIDLRNRIVAALSALVNTVTNLGRNIVQGFINGILSLWHNVTDVISRLINQIPGPIRKVLGIHSPSRVMIRIGRDITRGLAIGIADQIPVLSRTLASVTSTVTHGIDATPRIELGAAGGLGGGMNIALTVNVPPNADASEVGRQTVKAIEAYERRSGRRRLAA